MPSCFHNQKKTRQGTRPEPLLRFSEFPFQDPGETCGFYSVRCRTHAYLLAFSDAGAETNAPDALGKNFSAASAFPRRITMASAAPLCQPESASSDLKKCSGREAE